MARRKGKSERRIKDWHQRYNAQEEIDNVAPSRKSYSRKKAKLPQRELAAGAEGEDDLDRVEGLVTGLFPGGAFVRVGAVQMRCGLAGTFRPPEGASALAVGDMATVALTRSEHLQGQMEIDKDRSDGVILERKPRESALCRPQPRSAKRWNRYGTETFDKVIVANMEMLLIVASTHQPPLRHGLIDRFLIIAERGELEPLLVINKIDLGPPEEKVLDDFRSLGVEMILCSAETHEGLDELSAHLTGKRSVLAGASGVGKSTLINATIPGTNATTRTVRSKDERGRHTTSTSIIYDLPCGGVIVDTPGLRELGIHLDASELPWYFPEFEALVGECKFRNCTHTHEPDCAVIRDVEAELLPRRRYQSYLNILDTLDANRK